MWHCGCCAQCLDAAPLAQRHAVQLEAGLNDMVSLEQDRLDSPSRLQLLSVTFAC